MTLKRYEKGSMSTNYGYVCEPRVLNFSSQSNQTNNLQLNSILNAVPALSGILSRVFPRCQGYDGRSNVFGCLKQNNLCCLVEFQNCKNNINCLLQRQQNVKIVLFEYIEFRYFQCHSRYSILKLPNVPQTEERTISYNKMGNCSPKNK